MTIGLVTLSREGALLADRVRYAFPDSRSTFTTTRKKTGTRKDSRVSLNLRAASSTYTRVCLFCSVRSSCEAVAPM